MHIRSIIIGIAVLALGACDGAPTEVEGVRPGALSLSLVSGGGVGVVCTELAAPVVVRATRDGKPAKGQLVNFVVTRGGGSAYAGSAITDKDGYAREYWTFGRAGAQTLSVRAVDPSTGAKLDFGTFGGSAASLPDRLATPEFSLAAYPDDPRFVWLIASTAVSDACGDPMAGARVLFRVDEMGDHTTLVSTGVDGKVTLRIPVLEGNLYSVQVWVASDPTVRYDGALYVPAP